MKIAMSLTALQHLLAGKLPTEQFARDHGKLVQQFSAATDAGRLVSAVNIRACPDDDDDWVEIELNAVAPTHLLKEWKKDSKE